MPAEAFSGAPLAAWVNKSRTARRPSSSPLDMIDAECWNLMN